MTKQDLMNKIVEINKQVYELYGKARKVEGLSKDQIKSFDHAVDKAFENLCNAWFECRPTK